MGIEAQMLVTLNFSPLSLSDLPSPRSIHPNPALDPLRMSTMASTDDRAMDTTFSQFGGVSGPKTVHGAQTRGGGGGYGGRLEGGGGGGYGGGNREKVPVSSSLMGIHMSRSFPRSNSSFFLCSGNALQSDVVRLREETFLVDPGLGSSRICKQDDLTRVPINRATTRFENKVGYMDRKAGESLIRRKQLERLFIDQVVGDPLMKERAASRFNDLVGTTDSVAGEPHLLLPQVFRQNRAWMELNKIWRTNAKVRGFVVGKVRPGYSVAIAGFIAFIPNRPSMRQRLLNDKFNLEKCMIKGKKKDISVF